MIAVAAILGFGCGCGSAHTFPYVGTWLGHRKLTPLPGTDPHVVDEVSRLSLTLKNEGTFTMFDAGEKKEGEYSFEGDHVVLNVKTILDRPISRQDAETQKRNVPITVTPMGQKLKYFDAGGIDPQGLVLERVEKS